MCYTESPFTLGNMSVFLYLINACVVGRNSAKRECQSRAFI